jgi:hypothetical protein
MLSEMLSDVVSDVVSEILSEKLSEMATVKECKIGMSCSSHVIL